MGLVRVITFHLTVWLFLIVYAMPTSSQSLERSSGNMAVLHLNTPMRFINEGRMPFTIPAGTYQVSATLPEIIQLTASSTGTVWNLQAAPITHTESPAIPYPLLIEEGKDEGPVHLILLLPDGQGLDAEGRLQEIKSRGIGDMKRFVFTPTRRYSGVVMQQGRVATDADLNEQDAISSSEKSSQHPDVRPFYGRVTLEQGRITLDEEARQSLFRGCRSCARKQ